MAYANMRENMPRWTKIYAIFGTITERVLRKKIQSTALNHLYMFLCFGIFFRKSRSVSRVGDGPKKWHIFLFSTAYLPSYWHMPFEISIIIWPNWHFICTYNFHFPSPNNDVTSDDFGFFSRNDARRRDGPKNPWIRVNSFIRMLRTQESWVKTFFTQPN